MQLSLIEIIGYVASFFVALSLSMKSITKLRVLNMIGAFLFGTYGLIIGAYPVALVNYYIGCINIYHLIKAKYEQSKTGH